MILLLSLYWIIDSIEMLHLVHNWFYNMAELFFDGITYQIQDTLNTNYKHLGSLRKPEENVLSNLSILHIASENKEYWKIHSSMGTLFFKQSLRWRAV